MLQTRFATVCGMARLMQSEEINIVIRACVIVHYMIIKEECDNYELAVNYNVVEGTAL